MKLAVVGTGYVGLSNALLLARQHGVVALDVVPEPVAAINAGQSPIRDPQIEAWLGDPEVSLRATLSPEEAYRDATYVLIATPTDYDPKTNRFDTRSIDAVVQDVRRIQPQAAIVIKSTVPVGYTGGNTDGHQILLFHRLRIASL